MFVYIDRIVRFITVMVYFILDNRFAYILLCLIISTTDRYNVFVTFDVYMKFFCVYFYAIWGMARLEINL